MHLPITGLPVRLCRLLAVSAVATLVVLAPTSASDDPVGPVRTAAGTTDERDTDQRDSNDRDSNESSSNESSSNQSSSNESSSNQSSNESDSEESGSSESSASSSERAEVPPGGRDGANNGLDVLGRDCSDSDLAPHAGFQESPACVSTQMGEVAAEDKLPSLLITSAPDEVEVDESFQLEVSTRNLVRDRFLGAAEGGYYLESSFLDDDGLQRGHFHTACRLLPSTSTAPDSGEEPEFFLATQDNEGGAEPDTVTIDVPGIDTPGELQCTSWAGDGSHRTPMMTKANQTPAFDSVRITVAG